MASRKRREILVASAISFSEIPRISRSRRSSSPNDASSECCWGLGSGIEWPFYRPTREPCGKPHPHSGLRITRGAAVSPRSEEHTSELQSQSNLVCRLLLEKKK